MSDPSEGLPRDRSPRGPWRNVWVLGAASLLNDVASEMVMPLVPVFLVRSLGGGAAWLGAVEGTAELVASVLKWGSGVASDRLGRTRPFVVAGYGLASVARPFLAVASAPVHVLAVRLVDRVGKGLRTAPRDALLGASVPQDQRGAAFGVHRSMDHAGAAIGPLIALLVLTLWTQDLRVIFLVAGVPGLFAALVLAFAREVPREARAGGGGGLPEGLVRFLVPVGLASLGTVSESFLMLQAGVADDAPLEALPALWIALHVVRTTVSTPAGWLADRVPARWLVAGGWLFRAAVFGFLALGPPLWLAALGVVAYGGAAMSEAAEKKLVAACVGTEKGGTAFGVYHGVVGVCALPGALAFGAVWDQVGAGEAWGLAAGVLVVAVAALGVLAPGR